MPDHYCVNCTVHPLGQCDNCRLLDSAAGGATAYTMARAGGRIAVDVLACALDLTAIAVLVGLGLSLAYGLLWTVLP